MRSQSRPVSEADLLRGLDEYGLEHLPVRRLVARAPTPVIVGALRRAMTMRSLVRTMLCDILGVRRERGAVPGLVRMLSDMDPSVRGAAADALGKIADPRAGRALEEHFKIELNSAVRSEIAAALGAVGRKHAIPLLIESLDDPWDALRGCAAWSLGHMKTLSAEGALVAALDGEKNQYAKTRIEVALKEIRSARRQGKATGRVSRRPEAAREMTERRNRRKR